MAEAMPEVADELGCPRSPEPPRVRQRPGNMRAPFAGHMGMGGVSMGMDGSTMSGGGSWPAWRADPLVMELQHRVAACERAAAAAQAKASRALSTTFTVAAGVTLLAVVPRLLSLVMMLVMPMAVLVVLGAAAYVGVRMWLEQDASIAAVASR